jgi:hypothetical protein
MQRTLPPWTSPSRPFNPSDYGDPYKAPGRNNYSGHGNAQRGNSHLVDGVENRCVIRTLGRTTCDTSGSPVTRLICDTKSWGHQCGLFVYDRPGEIDLPSHRRGGSGERYFKAFAARRRGTPGGTLSHPRENLRGGHSAPICARFFSCHNFLSQRVSSIHAGACRAASAAGRARCGPRSRAGSRRAEVAIMLPLQGPLRRR